MTTTSAATVAARSIPTDPALEIEWLIGTLAVLERLTSFGTGEERNDFTSGELYWMFATLKRQAQAVATAMLVTDELAAQKGRVQ